MEEYSYTSTHPLDHTGPVTGKLYLYLLRPLTIFSSQFQPISCLQLRNYYLGSSSLRNGHSPPANSVLLRPLTVFSSQFQPVTLQPIIFSIVVLRTAGVSYELSMARIVS